MTEDRHHLNLMELLDGRGNVAQRSLAQGLGMSASQVNRILKALVDEGFVKVENPGVRPYAYRLTAKGVTHRRRLSHRHYRSVVGSFRQMEARIRKRMRELRDDGIHRVVFYGAGEVMEVAYPLATEVGLDVVGIVDDDVERHGSRSDGPPVEGAEVIARLEPCAVVITTFRHAGEIMERLGGVAVRRVVEL